MKVIFHNKKGIIAIYIIVFAASLFAHINTFGSSLSSLLNYLLFFVLAITIISHRYNSPYIIFDENNFYYFRFLGKPKAFNLSEVKSIAIDYRNLIIDNFKINITSVDSEDIQKLKTLIENKKD